MKAPSQLKLIQGLLVESRTMVRAFSVCMTDSALKVVNIISTPIHV